MKLDFDVYQKRFLELTKEGKFSRLGRNFKTSSHKYFYDTGTGKVFQISEALNDVLTKFIQTNSFDSIFELSLSEDELLASLKDLFNTVDEEHILQAEPVRELYGPQVYGLEEELSTQRTQLTLELTEKCNMRCKYCIYHEGKGGYREFGKNDMTFEVAKLAIDQFLTSSQKEQLYISFYGGEPLICFDMIKQCTEYCLKAYPDQNVCFTMTTNATLITEEIASYLASLPLTIITVSLDGPKDIHDSNRVFQNGIGSFEQTMKGLKYLVDAFGNRVTDCILFNSVITDYSQKALGEIQHFFDTCEWIPKNLVHTSSYVDTPDEEVEYQGVDGPRENLIRERIEQDELRYNPIESWGVKKFMDGNYDEAEIESLVKEGFIKDLLSIHLRYRSDKPGKIYGMNGCCVPGAKKIYVTTKGEYLICEKMGPSPHIGNVYDSIDIEKIKKYYVEHFRNGAVKYCKNCWAVNLCNICYTECFDEDDVNFSKRHRRCESHRITKENMLALYHEILENAPEKLEFLNDYKLT